MGRPIRRQLTLHEALSRGYHDIVFFAEEFLGMPLHEGQKKFLRNATAKTNVLVPANRWGKTTVVSVKHIHHCFYKIGIGRGSVDAIDGTNYTTVNLSPHSDTTRPVHETIIAILKSQFVITEIINGKRVDRTNDCKIGFFLDEKHIRNQPPLYIAFTNGSDILFRSTGEDQGKSIEGRSYGYISYDEGGQSGHLDYEHKRRIIPRLGQFNGQFDIVSTPEMTSASLLTHYRMFKRGGGEGNTPEEGFYSQEGSIEDNHYFLAANPTYVEDTLAQMVGDPVSDQILYGKFVFSGATIFPGDDIAAACDNSLDKGVGYEPGHTYVIGVDTAMGEDEMVFTVLDTTVSPFRMVRQIACKGNSKSPGIHMSDFADLVRQYKKINNVKIMLETWNGESAGFYRDIPYDLQLITTCWGSWQPPGLDSKTKSQRRSTKKEEIILAPRKLLAKRELRIPNDTRLLEQLSTYREDDGNLETDRVISLALACWLATDGAMKHNNEVVEVNW